MKRRGLLLLFAVLVACGGASSHRAPSSPPPLTAAERAKVDELELAATIAYGDAQHAVCAQKFEQLAEVLRDPRRKRHAYFSAAGCHALAGAIDAGFAALEAMSRYEVRNLSSLVDDDDLAALRADPRWAGYLARLQAEVAAWEKTLQAPELRRELLALVEEDQKARMAWIAKQDDPALYQAVVAIDQRTTARMKEVVAQHGWPGHRLVGEDGAFAAWLLVQHADRDVELQKRCLALMAPMIETGEVRGENYAYLYDRVAVAEKRPQRFGTQFDGDDPAPLEDAARVDERRAAVGLASMAVYREHMRRLYGPKPAEQAAEEPPAGEPEKPAAAAPAPTK